MKRPGRVVLVAQAFKESIGLAEVASAMERGCRLAGFQPVVVAASDGGDGLMEALAGDLVRRTGHQVTGPTGAPLHVEVGWIGDAAAVVESRLVCGLSLVDPRERDPRSTTTRGLGELIARLESEGARQILVGLGGSATMDGGAGMARAWGYEFLDAGQRPLPEGGGALEQLAEIRAGRRPGPDITGLVDVRNPLTGPGGAVQFAEQKGASPQVAERLARGLERLAARVPRGMELALRPGSGAAGGLGFGLLAFAGARLVPGSAWMLERLRLDSLLEGAAAVVAGEGRFDATSLGGKLTGEVLARASAAGVPGVLVSPTVTAAPPGRTRVETGGAPWSALDLERHVAQALARLSPP
jgi:glycerate kinase